MDIPAELARDIGLVQLPSQDVVSKIYERAAELARIETRIADLRVEIDSLRDDHVALSTKELPALFDQVGTDRFGVPGWHADVVLEPVYKAGISVEWPEERRETAFAEVERLGGGDMIRVQVSVQFGAKEFDLAAQFVQYIDRWNGLGGRAVSITKTIPWNTLTAWLREMSRKRVPMDLQAMGAYVGRACKIKWRK